VPRRFCVAATEAVLNDVPGLAVLQDRRHEVADAVDDAPDIDAHDERPVGHRHIHQPGTVHRHAGIVAGDVELAEAVFRLGQGVDHRLLLGDVDPDRQHLLVGAGQPVRRLFHRVLLDVGHHHVGASLGQCRGDAETDAGGGAGDDGCLAGNLHGPCPPEAPRRDGCLLMLEHPCGLSIERLSLCCPTS